jgi:small-conductance mechanosensitive channel
MGVFDDDGVDTDYYAKLLKEDSKPKTTKTEDAEFEEIPSSTESNSKNIEDYLDENTSSGMSIMELAGKKQQAERALKRKQSDQVSEMFSKLFNDLNQKYGLDVQLDFNSFSKSLNYIIQPKNKKALELYLSEAYGRFREV